MPAFSSVNIDESMMATLVGAAVGRVCVWTIMANATNAATATIMRNTFIAFGSLKQCCGVGGDCCCGLNLPPSTVDRKFPSWGRHFTGFTALLRIYRSEEHTSELQ